MQIIESVTCFKVNWSLTLQHECLHIREDGKDMQSHAGGNPRLSGTEETREMDTLDRFGGLTKSYEQTHSTISRIRETKKITRKPV